MTAIHISTNIDWKKKINNKLFIHLFIYLRKQRHYDAQQEKLSMFFTVPNLWYGKNFIVYDAK